MNRMKLRRLSAGLTQLELARLVGASEQQITKIETGRLDPPVQLRRRIAAKLGVDERYLLEHETLRFDPEKADNAEGSK